MIRRAQKRVSRLVHRAGRLWSRYRNQISPDQFRRSLDRVAHDGASTLLVHSSLSACGFFTSGVGDVVDGLQERCDTLVMPTHTYFYPDEPGSMGPVFDAGSSASKVGMITEELRQRPDVTRSIHSTHSLAISGTVREELCVGHYLSDAPCGEDTPYGRLVLRATSVLLLGVSFDSYTLFHTAEFASGSEFAAESNIIDRLRVIDEHGCIRVCPSRRQSRSPMRFAEVGQLLEAKGLVRREPMGSNFLLFVPDAAKVHDFVLQHLRQTPDFLRRGCFALPKAVVSKRVVLPN